MSEYPFPQRLRQLCARENRSQQVMAELFGLDRSTLRRYERGEFEPSKRALEAIADYFDVSIDYLVGRTENPRVNR